MDMTKARTESTPRMKFRHHAAQGQLTRGVYEVHSTSLQHTGHLTQYASPDSRFRACACRARRLVCSAAADDRP